MPNISEDDESASDGHEPDEEAEDDDGEEEEEEEEEEQPEGIILMTKLKNASLKNLEMLFQFQKKAVLVVVLGFVVGSPLSRDSNIQNLPHASKIKNDW